MPRTTLVAALVCALAARSGLAQQPQAKPADNAPFQLNLRSRSKNQGKISVAEIRASWEPQKTAIIVCDMWDDHWCKSATRRVAEMAGPMNATLRKARERGALIIHAPSTVTKFYENTPQRKLAKDAPFAPTPVALSTKERWGTMGCWPDAKREADLAIDDSDMGCDCAEKCKIRDAWTRQISTIEIAPGDAITDNGQETWNPQHLSISCASLASRRRRYIHDRRPWLSDAPCCRSPRWPGPAARSRLTGGIAGHLATLERSDWRAGRGSSQVRRFPARLRRCCPARHAERAVRRCGRRVISTA